ncbi:hypothetical protein OAO18_04030 [Francisellaceae bacterium]|nr:hypothetical protein [Francisellaceae bacterium]
MPTIFHEGFKLLRQEVGNPNYAQIADFLFFRYNVSDYTDKEGTFYLLPNVEHLSTELGFGKTLVKNALKHLEEISFIRKSKLKCYDGAVRTKIHITEDFKSLMETISMLKVSKVDLIEEYDETDVPDNSFEIDSDWPQKGNSDKTEKVNSIIKENKIKKKINNNMLKEPVILDFTFIDVPELASKYGVDATMLYLNMTSLEELSVFSDLDSLIDAAVQICSYIDGSTQAVQTDLHFSMLYEHVELDRGGELTTKQHLYLSSLLNYVGRFSNFDKCEVYSWVEFQLTNPDHHYQGKDFRHTCNIIKKSLLSGNVKSYCKPKGFKLAA